jgi:cytochrome c553
MFRPAPHALAVLACLAALPAHASDQAGRSLAGTCTGCHGPNGASVGGIPAINGMDAARMVELMQAFRDGRREATVMHQHAKGYTDEQIRAVAAWFAAQKAQP